MSSLVQHGTDERATLCRWCWCSDPQPLLPLPPSFLPSLCLPLFPLAPQHRPSCPPRSSTSASPSCSASGTRSRSRPRPGPPPVSTILATRPPSLLRIGAKASRSPVTHTLSLYLSRARFPFQQSTTTRPRPIKWPLMPAFAVDRRAYFLQRGSKALHHCRSTDTVQPSLCLYDKSDKSGAVYGVFAVR